jgi:heat shock protein HslJ
MRAQMLKDHATYALWLVLLTLSACESDSQRVSAPDLAAPAARWTSDILGEEWVLVAFVSADSSTKQRVDGTYVSLSFDADGRLHGSAGCNGFTGIWRLDDGNVRIGSLASTRMACGTPEGVMQQEQQFLLALEGAFEVLLRGESLRIDYGTAGDHLLLLQIIREQAPPQPVTDILWELEQFESGTGDAVAITDVVAESHLTAIFDEDGSVRGSAGCNDWGGNWSLQWSGYGEGMLSFDNVTATEMACESASIMAQEQRFLAALTASAQIVNDPDHLRLISADGSLVLSFIHRQGGPYGVLSIQSGTSFGECLGYCWQEVTLTEGGVTLRQRGWDLAIYPERSIWQPLAPGLWHRLTNLQEISLLQDLEDRIGCPDCADGGAEWLEIETTGSSKRVTYEHGSPPDVLRQLAEAGAQLRAELLGLLEVRTVVR